MTPNETITKVLWDRLRAVKDVLQFSRRQVSFNKNDYDALDTISEYEVLQYDLERAIRYINAELEVDEIIRKTFENGNVLDPVQFVGQRLLDIADRCEAGGHKSRARMFRAVAKEMEAKIGADSE